VQYGIDLKTFLVYLCVYPLLPYDRASEIVSDLFGHQVSPATVVAIVNECSQNLTGVEDDMRKLLQNTHTLQHMGAACISHARWTRSSPGTSSGSSREQKSFIDVRYEISADAMQESFRRKASGGQKAGRLHSHAVDAY